MFDNQACDLGGADKMVAGTWAEKKHMKHPKLLIITSGKQLAFLVGEHKSSLFKSSYNKKISTFFWTSALK